MAGAMVDGVLPASLFRRSRSKAHEVSGNLRNKTQTKCLGLCSEGRQRIHRTDVWEEKFTRPEQPSFGAKSRGAISTRGGPRWGVPP